MKLITEHLCHLLNSVKKFNDLKIHAYYFAVSITFFISKIMRILNY